MGHDDCDAPRLPQGGDGARQRLVPACVEVGIGLVQNNQLWFAIDRAGETDPLHLTAGKPLKAIADLGGVAVGQTQDHFIHASHSGGLDHALIRSFGIETGDVFADGSCKQFQRLRKIADEAAQIVGAPLVQRRAVEPHFAMVRSPRADQNARQRRFA